MAYIVDTKTSMGTSGTSTVSLAPHIENDVVFVLWNCLGPGTVTGPGGDWQEIILDDAGSADNQCYYQRVGASTLTDPVITYSTSSREPGAISLVVRGADVSTTTSCINDSDSIGSSSALNLVTSQMTLSGDSSLVLLFGAGERENESPVLASGSGIEMIYFVPSTSTNVFLAYNYSTGSTSETYKAYLLDDTAGGISLSAIAIKDNGTYINRGYISTTDPAGLVFLNIGNHISTCTEEDITDAGFTPQISSFTNSISGVTKSTIDDASTFSSQGGLHRLDPHERYGLTTQFNAGQGESSDLILVKGMTYSSNFDLSGQVLSFSAISEGKILETIDNMGRLIGFSDGTNASVFLFDGSNALVSSQNGLNTFLLQTAPNGSPTDLTGYEIQTFGSGNLDWSAIKTIFMGVSQAGNSSLYHSLGPLHTVGTLNMLGGGITFPCNFDDTNKATTASALNTSTAQAGQTIGQFYFMNNVSIGDGINDVYWKSKNQSVEFPRSYSYSEKALQCQIDAGALSLSINASSVNTIINLDTTTINLGNYHNFFINPSTSSLATYSFKNCNILNGNPTLNSVGSTISGLNIIGCKEVKYTTLMDMSGGCNIVGCIEAQSITITGSSSTALQSYIDKLANCTFTDNIVGIRIEYTGSGDISLNMDNIKFSTNTTDIHYNSTNTSELDINLQNGTIVSTTAISGNASAVNIISGAQLEFTGLANNTEVRVYNGTDPSTTIEIGGIENTTNGSFSMLHSIAGNTGYVVLHSLGYVPIKLNLTFSANNISIPIQQQFDRNYENN
jgi:hypothetical protein